MNLVFWQNIISPHQSPFMKEMSDAGHEVLVVSSEEMSNERRSLGWLAPSLGDARIVLNPALQDVFEIVKSCKQETIHIIAGARGTPLGRQALLACRKFNRRFGIISEAPDTRGLGGFLRWVKYSFEQLTLGGDIDFILAMGVKGVNWFSLCGYPKNKIFPFVYVVDRLSVPSVGHKVSERCDKGPFRFLFVGQLIPRKGIDIMLRALARSPGSELSIIGHGFQEKKYREYAKNLNISNRVFWLGQMNTQDVHKHISETDILILPSRHDGWGAVVNEALMLGVPVICSNACGACELINQPWLGSVFKKNNRNSLADVMSEWCETGGISEQHRERVRNWSKCIEASLVGKYLENVLNHVYHSSPKPKAPWQE